ncbi:cyclopropane-fatty-acyl-phospholipid synthase [Streptomyces sp. CB00316]|uniref:SAM-dependent methyltransferase n=1 Tax=unclassified Streptomyces TaxID=2593676 RepID=UPI000939202F|nr:class I SAM-dependent methyltransferase [Streptomyces sp. ISL-111]MBT2427638.1 class I SAM-dependent methyltransferase [Streptomyces sp. ISL-112]MBT2462610.1 class I SAM-dependent methyltransferase [Streptomyces sp. ISL-63]OKJ16407.1 cyclopropane-fatty-acyl-phospholipid synthase [Streptomyces sp. CB00316]
MTAPTHQLPADPTSDPAAPVPAQRGHDYGPADRADQRPPATDPERWPDIVTRPRASRARTAVAERIVRRALAKLPLRARLAGVEDIGLGGPLMDIRDPDAFFGRIGASGLIGFGESYMAGEWDAPDLVAVLTVLADNAAELVPAPLQRLRSLWASRKPAAQLNTPEGSRENVSHHYDLSNDLFALFLDETLSYSSAVFRGFPAEQSLLPAAQHRKIDRLLDAAGVREGTRLLEIGTGWGELAIRAAARGARVTTVTLSAEQRELARTRIREAGSEDRVEVRLRDYRQVTGEYDAIVSVEMIEAVGEEFWPVYFQTLDRLLAPGGRVALQAITMPDDRLRASRSTYTWIHKYIFPGGLLPSTEAIERVTTEHTRLRTARRTGYGAHYAETLRLWRERFTERSAEVDALGFDAVFRRMWTFYLAYSEAGFRSGYLDVQQLLLTRDPADRTGGVPAGGPTHQESP